MANNIIFTDGFDYYLTATAKWDVVTVQGGGSTPTGLIVAGVGRGGAGAFSVLASGNPITNATPAVQLKKLTGAQTSFVVGFAFYFSPGSQSFDCPVLEFLDQAGVTQVALNITSSGVLYVTRGTYDTGTVLGTAGSSYATVSYHYIEVQVVIGSGTSGSVTVKVDQAAVITITGANTQNTSFTTFAAITLGPKNWHVSNTNFTTYAAYFDDVYFDTLGFNGDVRINGQLPTGNGTTNNFTAVGASWASLHVYAIGNTIIDSNSNMQRIVAVTSDFKSGGSAPTWSTTIGVNTTDSHVTWVCLGAQSQFKFVNDTDPDGDSSYILDSTLNDISRFTFPSIVASTVKTVVVWAVARKDDGGYRAIQASVKSGATTATSGTDAPLGGNYQSLAMLLPTDPNTGTAWTASGVNGAEFGVKVTG